MELITAEILKNGRALSRAVKHESSIDLSEVVDLFDNSVVQSWRHGNDNADHALHRMVSRVGGFPPHLARYFIAKYSAPGDLVADPFCGKGTTLFEAARRGRAAVGGEVSPEAVIISRAKTRRVTIADVVQYIESLPSQGDAKGIPRDVAMFFNPATLRQLMAIRKALLSDMKRSDLRARIATFVCGVVLGILHGHSQLSLSLPCNQCFAMSPAYVRRYVKEHNLKRPLRDVKRCLIEKTLELLPAPRHVEDVFVYDTPAQTCHRYLNRFSRPVQLVVSSPPYLHRQTYAKDAWLRLWFLGRDKSELSSVSLETGSVNRFCSGMASFLQSLTRVLDENSHVVLVCGRANGRVSGKKRAIRIADVCLHALDQSCRDEFTVESIISDKKLMKRGSYYAVHAGRTNGSNGKSVRRYGEDEIVVLKYSKR